MGKLVRYISTDGTIVILAENGSDIVEMARQIHNTSKVCTAALGRLLVGTSLMGYMLKNDEDSVTVRMNGSGPSGSLITAADAKGNVRGYVMNPEAELPNKPNGKLDVGGVVGNEGALTVIKDLGAPEPTVGQVPIVSGEIAEDLTSYYAVSEQIPTVCALGVLLKKDHSVACAGGFLIQLLPTADDSVIEKVESGLKELPSVTEMMRQGLSLRQICEKALPAFDLDLLDEGAPEYRCNCSRQRVERALLSTGRESLEELAADEETEVKCHFCPAVYRFTSKEIRSLLKKSQA